MIVTARPELLGRRPGWGAGKLHSNTTTLQPLADNDVERLLGALCHGGRGDAAPGALPVPEAFRSAAGAVVTKVGGNPLFAVEFARMLTDGGRPPNQRQQG
jgi:predicted ATPase